MKVSFSDTNFAITHQHISRLASHTKEGQSRIYQRRSNRKVAFVKTEVIKWWEMSVFWAVCILGALIYSPSLHCLEENDFQSLWWSRWRTYCRLLWRLITVKLGWYLMSQLWMWHRSPVTTFAPPVMHIKTSACPISGGHNSTLFSKDLIHHYSVTENSTALCYVSRLLIDIHIKMMCSSLSEIANKMIQFIIDTFSDSWRSSLEAEPSHEYSFAISGYLQFVTGMIC